MTAVVGRVPVSEELPLTQARSMATRLPRASERLLRLAVHLIFWGSVAAYIVIFTSLSVAEYNAYLSHALDLGNMAQVFWNTVHGRFFQFQNMRAHVNIEAFGTNTRLSFHVEPLIPILAIPYAIYQHVGTLLFIQVVAVASGAIPARLLARRHLPHPLAELAFPIAYLLFPALEAANLYEFHPVTFAAPLLLWAFYFADSRRYTLFVLTAVAAMGTKEEIGVVVALIGLWIGFRQREWRFGVIVAVLGIVWSFIALKVVVPHFSGGDSSYWARYLPPGYPVKSYPVSQGYVMSFWKDHPSVVWDNLTSEAKRSFLQRLLYPAGFLSLLSPITALIGLPSVLLIILSYEPHMYGGLAHYSAELVPIVIVSAILGTEWLCTSVAPRLHIPVRAAVAVCSLYVLFAALANHHVNGFSPLSASYYYPPLTAHDRMLNQALALIPPDASVSAQDNLDAHLSDRGKIYLFPDIDAGQVQYIALDATQPTGSVMRPCDLAVLVTGDPASCNLASNPAATTTPAKINPYAILTDGRWNILFAQDGILILKHRTPGTPLHNVLPPAFYSFINTSPSQVPSGGPLARFGPYLELEAYAIDRREHPNLRNPDVVVTTWWKVLQPLPNTARLVHYLTDSTGALQVFSDDQPATSWLPFDRWQPGSIYRVSSDQLTVTGETSGHADVDIALTINHNQYLDLAHNEPVQALGRSGAVLPVGNGLLLKLTSISVQP